ncbi:lactate dehydrogenase [Mucor ambiguus]|uniref:Lactate dehydrogenase n=1 Tax=Mucor ambiguus TaxID=91626 RepID=A0A0C9MXU0_9FUNG|nr:lactate dehydrogenase [Mucor ambiguus]
MVHHPGRVSIIGAGTLGGTIAYSLLLANTAKEILLVDMSHNIVQGQVLDLAEVQSTTTIRAGTFKEAGQSTLVVLTADTPPNDKDKNRQQWLKRSRHLLLSIASSMSPVHSDIMILVTSDPVDLYVQSLQSYFPHVSPNRIFGLGTTMATDRLGVWLRDMMSTSATTLPAEIADVYCIGTQHSPVIAWQHAKVDGMPASALPNLIAQRDVCNKIVSNHRRYLICERKGKAWFGEASAATRLVNAIIKSSTTIAAAAYGATAAASAIAPAKNPVWVLSVNVPKYECCLSWPAVICDTGIKHLVDIPLSADEQAQISQVVESNIADFQASFDN